MSKQHWQFSILLLLSVCLHSICPILCAATAEKFCNLSDGFAEIGNIGDTSSCCHRAETDETEIPSAHGTCCGSNDLTFIIANDSHLVNNIGKTEVHQYASVVQFAVILPDKKEQFLSQYPFTTLTHPSFHNVISRRGPPFTRS